MAMPLAHSFLTRLHDGSEAELLDFLARHRQALGAPDPQQPGGAAQAFQLRDAQGQSALHIAVRRGFNRLLAEMLKAGADAGVCNDAGRAVMHEAVFCHNGAAVDVLLAAGQDINARSARTGETPLHTAILCRGAGAAAFVLARGGDPSLKLPVAGTDGMNALHLAVFSTPEILRALLARPEHALVHEAFRKGRQPMDGLRCALAEERADMLEVLIAHGVNVNARDEAGLTPLHFLIENRKSMEGALPLLRRLFESGADIHGVATNGAETPLMTAARTGWRAAFDYLLEQGAAMTDVSATGDTLLHMAAASHRRDILEAVLASGEVDIDARNRAGHTPLYVAAHRNRRELVEMLIAAGADPTIPDRKGRTPDMVCQGPLQTVTHARVTEAQKHWKNRGAGIRGRYVRPRDRRKIPSSKPHGNKR